MSSRAPVMLLNHVVTHITRKIKKTHKIKSPVISLIARRFDCGAEYYLDVQLLNSKKEVVHAIHLSRGNLEDTHWHKVAHTFKNYGPGVRYVLFLHQGKDTQYWAGHYGCKMAGGSVVAKLPASLIDRAHTDYSNS